MQIASRVRTIPPFKVASHAMVRNLNAQFLQWKTIEQIVAEAQGGYQPHARWHDHSLAADGQIFKGTGIEWGTKGSYLNDYEIYQVGRGGDLEFYLSAPAANWTLLQLEDYDQITIIKLHGRVNAEALALGDSTREGGDIAVYRDTSGNKQMILDADADGATVKTGLSIYADVKAERVGSGFVLKSPNGTAYRIKVANDGTLSTEAE